MKIKTTRFATLLVALGIPTIVTHPVFAAASSSVAGVSNVESFISSVTKVVVLITGAVAITMFAIGGFGYVTSSGNPEHLQRSKHTLLYAAIGLAIAIGSAVIGGIVTALANNAFGG
jgi:Type IV secretion system pilin